MGAGSGPRAGLRRREAGVHLQDGRSREEDRIEVDAVDRVSEGEGYFLSMDPGLTRSVPARRCSSASTCRGTSGIMGRGTSFEKISSLGIAGRLSSVGVRGEFRASTRSSTIAGALTRFRRGSSGLQDSRFQVGSVRAVAGGDDARSRCRQRGVVSSAELCLPRSRSFGAAVRCGRGSRSRRRSWSGTSTRSRRCSGRMTSTRGAIGLAVTEKGWSLIAAETLPGRCPCQRDDARSNPMRCGSRGRGNLCRRRHIHEEPWPHTTDVRSRNRR